MTIKAILAHDAKYGIGKNGGLPWPHSDADMKWFRDCTRGHIVVMGRKTWDSIGHQKLSHRHNIVVSSKSDVGGSPDKIVSGDIRAILSDLEGEHPDKSIWVIGGADLYCQALPICDHIYITEFSADYECDTFIDMKKYLRGYFEACSKESSGLKFKIWSRFG